MFAAVVLVGCDQVPTGAATTSSPASSSSSTTANPQPTDNGTATLSWQAPTTDTDGAPLTNLAGYRIYYGTSASDLSQTVQIAGVGIQTYVIDGLSPGTWYFAMTAVTSTGVESALSDIVSKTIG